MRHGMRYSRAYSIWTSMVSRCTNPARDKFKFYGGRGIKVCEPWLEFANFHADMGDPPDGYTLDRIDSDGDYCKSNCRWADTRTQTVNRKNLVLYEYCGRSLTLPEICREAGINYRTMRNRLFRTCMTLDAAIAHEFGSITESGRRNMTEAVVASNKRRGRYNNDSTAQGVKK